MSKKADCHAKEARDDGIVWQLATQKRLAMTDSKQIAMPCFAGTGVKEARSGIRQQRKESP